MGEISDADEVLLQFDTEQKAVSVGRGAQGLGGAVSGNEWALRIGASTRSKELIDASKSLSKAAVATDGGGVILSVFAGSPVSGVEALRSWVDALDLPPLSLDGLADDGVTFSRKDENGDNVPLDMDGFGATLLMYHSKNKGQTTLMSYGGDFRGVAVNFDLRDGEYRQYGYLPLALHDPKMVEKPLNPFGERGAEPRQSAYESGRTADEFEAVRHPSGGFTASTEAGGDMVLHRGQPPPLRFYP